MFIERSKILLSDKIIRVEFLVPFPLYDFSMKPDIEAMIYKLCNLWQVPSLFCPLIFSSVFATNSSGFNVNWMLLQIENEIADAPKDLLVIRNETSVLLSPPKPEATRQRSGAAVGMAALAAVGFCGSGVAMGNSDSCGLRGIFGGCHDHSQAIAENVQNSSEVQDVLPILLRNSPLIRMKRFSGKK